MHLSSGCPEEKDTHNSILTREMLTNSTKMRLHESDNNRWHILEALLIRKEKPIINKHTTGNQLHLNLTNAE